MKKEELLTIFKGLAPPAIAVFQSITEWLPVWTMWMGGIYATLHLYVFVRDRFLRNSSGGGRA
ncbi:hypothetical protein [Paraburkholderia caribensis]|uniref:hypothetical protein n=1 Tax=Paraburkholderia caribensis TaxID=75105 RepID=UPI0007222DA6|nr:hypothetical protein [Paraburkholderia caribensis]ALP62833.1 hypothetical protein AN416_09640 [Paraburkholderia caribensis]AUT51936.1 hypothetical protein C2L66_08760 [Paraburkholderia caribensis]